MKRIFKLQYKVIINVLWIDNYINLRDTYKTIYGSLNTKDHKDRTTGAIVITNVLISYCSYSHRTTVLTNDLSLHILHMYHSIVIKSFSFFSYWWYGNNYKFGTNYLRYCTYGGNYKVGYAGNRYLEVNSISHFFINFTSCSNLSVTTSVKRLFWPVSNYLDFFLPALIIIRYGVLGSWLVIGMVWCIEI